MESSATLKNVLKHLFWVIGASVPIKKPKSQMLSFNPRTLKFKRTLLSKHNILLPITGETPNVRKMVALPEHYRWERPWHRSNSFRNFVFLRTKMALAYSTQAIDSFMDLQPEWIRILKIDGDYLFWDDGLILHCDTYEQADNWPKIIGDALSHFDAWAIADNRGNYSEALPNGTFSGFFEPSTNMAAVYSGYAQIFLQFQENSKNPNDLIDQVRVCFDQTKCRPVFHYRNGRVLFLRTTDPASIILRRVERHSTKFRRFVVIDSENEFLSANGSVGHWECGDLDLSQPNLNRMWYERPADPFERLSED